MCAYIFLLLFRAKQGETSRPLYWTRRTFGLWRYGDFLVGNRQSGQETDREPHPIWDQQGLKCKLQREKENKKKASFPPNSQMHFQTFQGEIDKRGRSEKQDKSTMTRTPT